MTDKLGRMMGLLATITNTPLEDILAMYKERFLPGDDAYRRNREAALDEHSSTLQFSLARIFSLEAYLYPAENSIPQLEHGLIDLRDEFEIDFLVAKAYQAPAEMRGAYRVTHRVTSGARKMTRRLVSLKSAVVPGRPTSSAVSDAVSDCRTQRNVEDFPRQWTTTSTTPGFWTATG